MEEKFNKSEQSDEQVDLSEIKTLSTVRRMEIAEKIIYKYSMLKEQKGILHEQLFSAMEDYLEECGIAGVVDLAHTRLTTNNK